LPMQTTIGAIKKRKKLTFKRITRGKYIRYQITKGVRGTINSTLLESISNRE
jgi:hypothetical protein